MIHEAPVFASSGLPGVAEKVRSFILAAQEAAAGGISVAEFGELAVALMRVVIAAAESIPADGARKKAWVVEAVGLLFDAVADEAVPTLAYPVWLVVRPTVRTLVLMAAAGAVESLLPLVRKAAA
jgi:hypothetical protein